MNHVLQWDFAPEIPEAMKNDEEVIRINIPEMNGGYVMIYLYSDDFDPHLNRLEAIKPAEYRLYEASTDTNFLSGTLGQYHDGMFAINPEDLKAKPVDKDADDGALAQPEPALKAFLGCFFLQHVKGGVIVDHMTSHAYERTTEQSFVERCLDKLKTMIGPGDFKGLKAFWQARLEEKRSIEEAQYAKQRKTIMDDEDEDEDKASPTEKDKRQIMESSQVKEMTGSELCQFIGPIKIDMSKDSQETLVDKVDAFLTEKKPNIRAEYPDGFEVLLRGKTLKHLSKLAKLKDYRNVTLHPLAKEVEPADQAPEGGEPQDKAEVLSKGSDL
jgi:hypothetical protein